MRHKSETPKAKEENKEKSSSFSLQQKKAMLEAVKEKQKNNKINKQNLP